MRGCVGVGACGCGWARGGHRVRGRALECVWAWGGRGVCWVCRTGSSCVPALPHRLHHSANGALGTSTYFDLRRRLVFLLVDPRTSTSSGFASLTHLPLLRGRLSICRMHPLRPKLELQNGRKKPSPMQGKALYLPDESASSRDNSVCFAGAVCISASPAFAIVASVCSAGLVCIKESESKPDPASRFGHPTGS